MCKAELKAPTETEPHKIPIKINEVSFNSEVSTKLCHKLLILLARLAIFQSNSIQDQCVFNKNLALKTTEFLEVKQELLQSVCKTVAKPRTEQLQKNGF